MKISRPTLSDLDKIFSLEAQCFSAEEAASKKALKIRLESFPDTFWAAWENGEIVALIDGMRTDAYDLTDDMYDGSEHYRTDGERLMLYGVMTSPAHRGEGLIKALMPRVFSDCRERGVKEAVLTCKQELLSFYEQFGFVSEGASQSCHGGAKWYQMRKRL